MKNKIILILLILFTSNIFAQNTRIKLTFNNNEIYATITNSKSANDFLSQLPITLEIKDYNLTEKIGYLNKKLNIDNEPDGITPKIGDITYFAPWGNIAIFYKNFRYSKNLIYLGRFENVKDIEKLLNVKYDFNMNIEIVK